MARAKKTRGKKSGAKAPAGKASRMRAAGRSSKSKSRPKVRGAAPYQPKMSSDEVLAEIRRVSGEARRLSDVRDALPAGRTGRRATAKPGAAKAKVKASKVATAKGGPGKGAGGGPLAAGDDGAVAFTTEERLLLVDQARHMLEGMYAHLPLKRALHAIDPIQRLNLLRLRQDLLDEREFQSEMIDIFIGLRDLHTNYTLPSVYWPKFAFLPFRVEEYYGGKDQKERRYLISWVAPTSTDPTLKAGMLLTHWNGSPIDLAVARNAARQAGSNSEARRARGLEALTLRWLGASLPPDEDWVTLTYTDGKKTFESRFEWQVVVRDDLIKILTATGEGAAQRNAGLGLDVKAELLRRVRKSLFDAHALKVEAEVAEHKATGAGIEPGAEVSAFPDVYPRFGAVKTPSGTFGYIRLATFMPEGPDPNTVVDDAVVEFVRILRLLPPSGLILDVRGNGGGYINFGERILQTMTPQPIVPEPFHFLTTPLTLQLAQSIDWLGQWADPLSMSMATGAGFSQGFPLTDPEECNSIGQVYQGPVVLITDAFCYSTTDIFSAGFQDHGVGTILGCHDNTGAGGANVWDYEQLLQQLDVTPKFDQLPGGAGLRVAARRSTRVGDRSGVPLEDLGVVPDERHFMTEADLLEHNVDLIAHAAKILAKKDKQTLAIAAVGGGLGKFKVTASNLDRVDILAGDRPVVSQDIAAGATEIKLARPLAAGSLVTARGYRGGKLVASARLEA